MFNNPIISEAASYIAGHVADHLLGQFRTKVIDRWTRHRARQFILAFGERVSIAQASEEEIRETLNQILEDEKKSEVLFEAYRSVCLSRSKTIGPRAIGLLTARILAEDREATGFEEVWFQIYESFGDIELISTLEFYRDSFQIADAGKRKDYHLYGTKLVIDWREEVTEFKSAADRDPINLWEALGPFGGKLGQFGLISTSVQEKVWDYEEDSERHIDQDGTARKVTWKIYADRNDEECALLIAQAIPREASIDGVNS
jgi:hypothetical protein